MKRFFWALAASLMAVVACDEIEIPGINTDPEDTTVPVGELKLDKNSVELEPGQSVQLTATVLPDNATDKTVTWSSSKEEVATVKDGLVTAVAAGEAVISAKAGEKEATCTVIVKKSAPAFTMEAVDLGLSVKWAKFNVGSERLGDYGDYFAWGDPEPYYEEGSAYKETIAVWKAGKEEGYEFKDYKWYSAAKHDFTKYNDDKEADFYDHNTVLDPEDDPATVILGGNWRTPTLAEWEELLANCTLEFMTTDDASAYDWRGSYAIKGIKFTSKKAGYTDKWIFLPGAGQRSGTEIEAFKPAGGVGGTYFSSTLGENQSLSVWKFGFSIKYKTNEISPELIETVRYWGHSVRAVTK